MKFFDNLYIDGRYMTLTRSESLETTAMTPDSSITPAHRTVWRRSGRWLAFITSSSKLWGTSKRVKNWLMIIKYAYSLRSISSSRQIKPFLASVVVLNVEAISLNILVFMLQVLQTALPLPNKTRFITIMWTLAPQRTLFLMCIVLFCLLWNRETFKQFSKSKKKAMIRQLKRKLSKLVFSLPSHLIV